jgi:1-acyl-sn-glycerol-3-phosphate acyltransferase
MKQQQELKHKVVRQKTSSFNIWILYYSVIALIAFLSCTLVSAIMSLTMTLVWVIHKLQLISVQTSMRLYSLCAKMMAAMFVTSVENILGIDIEFSGDNVPEYENAVVISNHVTNMDVWLILALAHRKGMSGNLKFMAKEPLKQ